MQRLTAFDIAKAVCIILVVVGHYVPEDSPAWYLTVHNVIYLFHMPLFMFASGYIYNATRNSTGYGKFIAKKFRRLMIPYFSTSFIVITIKLLAQGRAYVESPVTVWTYIQALYSPSAGYFLWFIWALWWMFMLVPVFKTVKERTWLCGAAVVFCLLPMEMTKVLCLAEFKNMFLYFMLGVVCFDYRKYVSFVRCSYSGVILFVMAIVLEYSDFINGGGKIILRIFSACSGILMVMQLSYLVEERVGKRFWNWLISVSASSYVIYLFHTTFEGFTKSLIYKMNQGESVDGAVFVLEAIVVIVSGVVGPLCLHRYILSKSRVLRILFGLK